MNVSANVRVNVNVSVSVNVSANVSVSVNVSANVSPKVIVNVSFFLSFFWFLTLSSDSQKFHSLSVNAYYEVSPLYSTKSIFFKPILKQSNSHLNKYD